MAKLSRGKGHTSSVSKNMTKLSNDTTAQIQTRVGKQTKFGPLKARAPGRRIVPKRLGG
jgi:hypothetical protein